MSHTTVFTEITETVYTTAGSWHVYKDFVLDTEIVDDLKIIGFIFCQGNNFYYHQGKRNGLIVIHNVHILGCKPNKA